MNVDLCFPTPIWWEHTGIDTSEMVNLTYRLMEQDPRGRRLSNQGGWQSQDFRPGVHPELAILENKISLQTEQCVLDFGYDPQSCFTVLENLWINVNRRFHSNSVHIHDNSFMSGAFYLKAAPGQGNINFYKSYSQDYAIASAARIAHYTSINNGAITFPPETGKLIMFPGWLPHGVEENESDSDRISISFNTKIIRTDDEYYRTAYTERNKSISK
jgi:uncharacterized protein (TIGR02466 family)